MSLRAGGELHSLSAGPRLVSRWMECWASGARTMGDQLMSVTDTGTVALVQRVAAALRGWPFAQSRHVALT